MGVGIRDHRLGLCWGILYPGETRGNSLHGPLVPALLPWGHWAALPTTFIINHLPAQYKAQSNTSPPLPWLISVPSLLLPQHPGGSHFQVRGAACGAEGGAVLGRILDRAAFPSSDVGVEMPVILMHPKPDDSELGVGRCQKSAGKRHFWFRGELVKATLVQLPQCQGPCSALCGVGTAVLEWGGSSFPMGWAQLSWSRVGDVPPHSTLPTVPVSRKTPQP